MYKVLNTFTFRGRVTAAIKTIILIVIKRLVDLLTETKCRKQFYYLCRSIQSDINLP